jgi:Rad3-related DNA helicase
LGNQKELCPYYLQKQRAQKSDLILMPYQYLISKNIRESLEVDFDNSIVIIDEAHNIISACEETASVNITDEHFDCMIKELVAIRTYRGSLIKGLKAQHNGNQKDLNFDLLLLDDDE